MDNITLTEMYAKALCDKMKQHQIEKFRKLNEKQQREFVNNIYEVMKDGIKESFINSSIKLLNEYKE